MDTGRTYLGVCFYSGPETIDFNKPFKAELGLIYWPHEQYESLVPGTTFTLREGPAIVGFGSVLRHLGERPLRSATL